MPFREWLQFSCRAFGNIGSPSERVCASQPETTQFCLKIGTKIHYPYRAAPLQHIKRHQKPLRKTGSEHHKTLEKQQKLLHKTWPSSSNVKMMRNLRRGGKWTSFNQTESEVSPEVTSIWYMPIILAPAHELDTLNTVVLRCRHVAKKLEQHHVVLTVDEALFCKLMDLKWAKPQYQDFLVVRLGGPHTALKFMEVNLLDLWKHGSRAICLAPKQLKRLRLGSLMHMK